MDEESMRRFLIIHFVIPNTTQSLVPTSSHSCCESVTDTGGKGEPASKCAVFTVITKNVLVTCWEK